jgi:hypothetical protein
VIPARATALLLIAPLLTFASALAPQHVHESGPGHESVVAHSHFAPHEVAAHNADTTEIEHDIDHVVWLDGTMLHQPIHEATHVPPALPVYEAVPPTNRWSVLRFDNAPPAHGPPKSPSFLRGPPFVA